MAKSIFNNRRSMEQIGCGLLFNDFAIFHDADVGDRRWTDHGDDDHRHCISRCNCSSSSNSPLYAGHLSAVCSSGTCARGRWQGPWRSSRVDVVRQRKPCRGQAFRRSRGHGCSCTRSRSSSTRFCLRSFIFGVGEEFHRSGVRLCEKRVEVTVIGS